MPSNQTNSNVKKILSMIQTLYLNRQHSGLARNQKLSNSYLDTGSRVLSDPPKLQNGTFKKE